VAPNVSVKTLTNFLTQKIGFIISHLSPNILELGGKEPPSPLRSWLFWIHVNWLLPYIFENVFA
jgi:hypothetical protein